MGFAEVIAFIKALPEIVKFLNEISSTLRQLKQDSIDRELESIKKEVDSNIQKLITAKSDSDRKQALLELSRVMGK